jgi:hypothetical protein
VIGVMYYVLDNNKNTMFAEVNASPPAEGIVAGRTRCRAKRTSVHCPLRVFSAYPRWSVSSCSGTEISALCPPLVVYAPSNPQTGQLPERRTAHNC